MVVTKKERRASKELTSKRASAAESEAETIQVTIDGSSSPKSSDDNNKGPVEMERKSDVAAVEMQRRTSSIGTPRPVVGMEPKIKRENSKNTLGGTEWNKQAAQLRREAFLVKDKVERSEFKKQARRRARIMRISRRQFIPAADLGNSSRRFIAANICAQLWTAVKKHFTRLSRMRHSLYSLVRPLQCDEDNYNTDPLYLRDEQARCRRDAAEIERIQLRAARRRQASRRISRLYNLRRSLRSSGTWWRGTS